MARRCARLLAFIVLLGPIAAWALDTAKPEDVGLSADRLARIGPALNKQVEAQSFPGAVALVARKGRIAYFEATGRLDPRTLFAVLMTQAPPGAWQREFKELFRQLVYQAIVD